jgi:hypothetical protein
MQQLTDLRRQVAATAAEPLGLTTAWPRIWAKQVWQLGGEVGFLRQAFDLRYHTDIQDLNPASPFFGDYLGPYEDPFKHPAL